MPTGESVRQVEVGLDPLVQDPSQENEDQWPVGEVSRAEVRHGRLALLVRRKNEELWPAGRVSRTEVGPDRVVLPVNRQNADQWLVLTGENDSRAEVDRGQLVQHLSQGTGGLWPAVRSADSARLCPARLVLFKDVVLVLVARQALHHAGDRPVLLALMKERKDRPLIGRHLVVLLFKVNVLLRGEKVIFI